MTTLVQALKQHLKEYIGLAAKQSGIVLIGDVVAKALTFAISLTVMKFVSPAEYIVFGMFLTVQAIIAQLADSGVNQSFTRFYALYAPGNPARANAHYRLALQIKIVVLAAFGVVLYIFAEPLAVLSKYPELKDAYRLLSIGVIGVGFFEFFQAVFQARQDFKQLTALRVSEAALKIGFIYLFASVATFSLTTVYIAYAAVPLAVILVVFAFSKKLRVHAEYDKKDIGGELFSFVRWLMLTSFAMIFLQHLDVLLIGPMLVHNAHDAGLFVAGKKLCTPFFVLSASIATVFFPKAMALRTVEEMKRYVKRTLQVSVPVAAGSAFYVVALYLLIPAYFPDYTSALPVVYILYIGWAWTIIGNPLTMLMLSLNKANVATAVSIVQLVVTIVSHYLFIQWLGGVGAALSNVVIWFAAGSYSLWYIYTHRKDIEHVHRLEP